MWAFVAFESSHLHGRADGSTQDREVNIIRNASILVTLPVAFGFVAASPAYAYWHHGGWGGRGGWHGGWRRPGFGVGVGVAAGAAIGLGVGAALAAPHYVAPAPVVVAPPPVYYPPSVYAAPPPVAYVP